MSVTVTFLGSGDAFASGGRFQTCFLVEGGGARFLIDCGATSLVALRRHGIDPNAIDAIVLSHLHGDHFGGLPFFILSGHLDDRRRNPLTIAGPPETRARLEALCEVLYPGMTGIELRFPLEIVEMAPGGAHRVLDMTVTPYEANHSPASNPSALRIEYGERIIGYSGDGAWSETLIEAARGADLWIAECNFIDRGVPGHMDFRTLSAGLDRLAAKRVILTHMGREMLAQVPSLPCEFAEDGMTVEV